MDAADERRRLDPERLLAHAEWLERLALGLVREPHAAQDLVQDTWLVALSRPPRDASDDRGLRAWLARVLRNASINSARAEFRRRERETSAAPRELESSDPSLDDRLHLTQVLADAVVELELPYRNAIALHYMDGLSIREIAERERISEDNARHRISRGLAKLRERLDREFDGGRSVWGGVCLALASHSHRAVPFAIAGGVLVSTKWMIGVAVVVLATALGVWSLHESSASPTATPVAAAPTSSNVAELTSSPIVANSRASVDASSSVGREHVDASSAVAAASIRLFGVVRPIEGSTTIPPESKSVGVTDRLGREIVTEADTDGNYSTSLAPGRYWVSVRDLPDCWAHEFVELDASTTEKRLDLQLVLPPQILVKAVDENGEPIAGAGVLAVATLKPPGAWLDEVWGSLNNPLSVSSFQASWRAGLELPEGYLGRVQLDASPPVFVSLLNNQRVVATKLVEVDQAEVEFVVQNDSPLLKPATVRFRFVDAQTRAVLPSTFAMVSSGPGVRAVHCNDGWFNDDKVAPGSCSIRAMVPGYESYQHILRFDAGTTNDLGDIPLERECWISGTILGDGIGVSMELDIERWDPDRHSAIRGPSSEGTKSDERGSFKIGGLSRGFYVLRRLSQDGGWACSSTIVDTTNGPVDNLRIELVPGVPLALRPSNNRWFATHFRILDRDGNGVLASRLWSAAPQNFSLAPGNYVVEATSDDGGEPVRHEITIEKEPVELALP